MPTPRRIWFRFSLRTLFVVMAIAALGLVLWRRAESLRRNAAEHSKEAIWYGIELPFDAANSHEGYPSGSVSFGSSDESNERLREYWRSMQRYHKQLADKSERMIWEPWLAMEKDPPMPSGLYSVDDPAH